MPRLEHEVPHRLNQANKHSWCCRHITESVLCTLPEVAAPSIRIVYKLNSIPAALTGLSSKNWHLMTVSTFSCFPKQGRLSVSRPRSHPTQVCFWLCLSATTMTRTTLTSSGWLTEALPISTAGPKNKNHLSWESLLLCLELSLPRSLRMKPTPQEMRKSEDNRCLEGGAQKDTVHWSINTTNFVLSLAMIGWLTFYAASPFFPRWNEYVKSSSLDGTNQCTCRSPSVALSVLGGRNLSDSDCQSLLQLECSTVGCTQCAEVLV